MAADIYNFDCGASGYAVLDEDGGNIFVEAYSANCHACVCSDCPYASAKAVYLVCGWSDADELIEEWGEVV